MTTYVALDTYRWGDEDKCVKVYVEPEGVGSLKGDQVALTARPDSFDLRLTNCAGRNLRLNVSNLNAEIDSEKVSFKITPKRLVVTLPKKNESKWWDLVKRSAPGSSSFNPGDD